MIALILSILLPGLGQLYYGEKWSWTSLCCFLGLQPLYIVALVWSIVDIIILNKQGVLPAYKPKEAVWAVVILVFIVPVFLFISFYGIFSVGQWYSNKYIFPGQTLSEIQQISNTVDDFYSTYGKYPNSIDEIVKNNPIRNEWYKDSWGQPYHYKVSADGMSYTLISKGSDMSLNTDDDILKSNNKATAADAKSRAAE